MTWLYHVVLSSITSCFALPRVKYLVACGSVSYAGSMEECTGVRVVLLVDDCRGVVSVGGAFGVRSNDFQQQCVRIFVSAAAFFNSNRMVWSYLLVGW
jgi:hypothetical protein